MANTIFSKGDIIEGEYNGQHYKFEATNDGVEGSSSIYGPGMDLLLNKKVFLKKYTDPRPRSEWFSEFIDYQNKIQEKIKSSKNAQKMIAGIHLYFQDERKHFWQSIEYVENSKDLKRYLESSAITWDQRKTFAKVFMYAMKVLHQEVRLVHGDLKPANLLLIPQGTSQKYNIKLIDFDRPILLDEDAIPWQKDQGFIGSAGYFSPEHLKGERPTEKSDIFTCGIILCELLTNVHPFHKANVSKDYRENTANIAYLLGSFGSPEHDSQVLNVLRMMLEPNQNDRPSAEQVHKALMQLCAEFAPALTNANAAAEPVRPFVEEAPVHQPQENEPTQAAADVVFLMDTTGSMGGCITQLKKHIHSFIHSLVNGNQNENIAPVENWRARVVGYRNFMDCNKSANVAKNYKKLGKGGWFISNPFTRDENALHSQLDSLKAFGGGSDPRESLLDALMLVLKSGFLPAGEADPDSAELVDKWRSRGTGRIVVVFTDAGFMPTMSYNSEKTLFEEKEKYQLNLEGGGLDELQHAIESGFFKIYIFTPKNNDYDELSDLTNVIIFNSEEVGGLQDGQNGKALVSMVEDGSKFERLIEDIVKGVSRSSSDYRELSF
ncbi:MAG: protein kinase [Fibrobacteraceae bacterium]|nr:protein kinase [Fibrobacteraceae bacterium]